LRCASASIGRTRPTELPILRNLSSRTMDTCVATNVITPRMRLLAERAEARTYRFAFAAIAL
jgi:hypothetical protein